MRIKYHRIVWCFLTLDSPATKMPINWNDKEVLERLFIATLASFDNKVSTTTHCNSLPQTILTRRFRQIDIKEVARLHGGDMTYHALENRLRKWKKEATALKDETEGREGAAKSPVKTRARKGAASPAKGGTYCGYVQIRVRIANPGHSCQDWADHEEESPCCYQDQV
jgi:hypothetical protein